MGDIFLPEGWENINVFRSHCRDVKAFVDQSIDLLRPAQAAARALEAQARHLERTIEALKNFFPS